MGDTLRTCPAAVRRETAGVMWKTVSDHCNLACGYCYYSTRGGRPGPTRTPVSDELLEKTIRAYMTDSCGSISFGWQGGEPLLAGLPFFEKVVALQAHYAPRNTLIGNAVQTNGTLLTDDWARFFRKYNFLVGVSIDGPKEIHDACRVTATGRGSYDLAMRGIAHLRNHDVDFNILTVLHPGNVEKARELMAFYESEHFGYVQFIPGMNFRAQSPDTPPAYLITPAQYGEFLCQAFDIWYDGGTPGRSVRFFDNVLGICAGHKPEACSQQRTCSQTLVLEVNGDAYPCDFYMSPAYRLGNIGTDSLQVMLDQPVYRQFLKRKENLPPSCCACEYLHFCYGGCPRNRTLSADGRTSTPDYFCAAYRQFFDHAHDRLTLLAGRLRTRRLFDYARSGQPWPLRNAPCLCGSGKKFKRCCASLRDSLMQSRSAR